MQILILSLMTLFFASCGGSKKTDNWKAPNMYFLRADGNKSSVLANRDNLVMTDYIYFTEDQHANAIDLANKKSDFTVHSQVHCVKNGKASSSTNSYAKAAVQIKEIIPEKSLFTSDDANCKITMTLQNSNGSTKSYVIAEKNISTKNFKDFTIPDIVTEGELASIQVPDLKGNESVDLVCEMLSAGIKNTSQALALDQFTSQVNSTIKDIPLKQYMPHQNCRLSVRRDESKLLSNGFQIHFEKLIPQYSYRILDRTERSTLYVYSMELKNPHSVPLTVAINQSSLKNVELVQMKHVGREHDRDIYVSVRHNLKINFSSEVISKNNIYVIHLNPGETMSAVTTLVTGGCDSYRCTSVANKSPPPSPLRSLKYNYRSIEEIEAAADIETIDSVPKN